MGRRDRLRGRRPPTVAGADGPADIQRDLDRRRPGQSRFTWTQRREPDEVKILSGVMIDDTSGAQVPTGSPIAVAIENVDQRSKDYSEIRRPLPPRPCRLHLHDAKYGLRDYRGGGRASSSGETAARVAGRRGGAQDHPRRDGACGAGCRWPPCDRPRPAGDWDEVARNPNSSVRMPPRPRSSRTTSTASASRARSIGAVIEVIAEGAPVGLGAPVYGGKLDSDIAAALMSVNAVKGVEIGAGFAAAALSGEGGQCRRDAGRQ